MKVRAVLVLFVALGLALGACTDDGEEAGGDETTTTAKATSTTVDSDAAAEAEALDAYEQSWVDFIRAANPPDPDAPYLADHITGDNLTTTRNALKTFQAEGTGMRGAFETDARVAVIRGDTATVEDCGLDQVELILVATGEVLESPNADRDGKLAELVREDGAWKVSNLTNDDSVCEETDG